MMRGSARHKLQSLLQSFQCGQRHLNSHPLPVFQSRQRCQGSQLHQAILLHRKPVILTPFVHFSSFGKPKTIQHLFENCAGFNNHIQFFTCLETGRFYFCSFVGDDCMIVGIPDPDCLISYAKIAMGCVIIDIMFMYPAAKLCIVPDQLLSHRIERRYPTFNSNSSMTVPHVYLFSLQFNIVR